MILMNIRAYEIKKQLERRRKGEIKCHLEMRNFYHFWDQI